MEVLPPRQLQCFRCLEPGHAGANCRNPVDRSMCCFRCGQPGHKSSACDRIPDCPACRAAGLDSKHKISSKTCTARSGMRRKGTEGGARGPVAEGSATRTGIPRTREEVTPTPRSGGEDLPPKSKREPRREPRGNDAPKSTRPNCLLKYLVRRRPQTRPRNGAHRAGADKSEPRPRRPGPAYADHGGGGDMRGSDFGTL